MGSFVASVRQEIRECSAPIVEDSRRMRWPGGQVELLSRISPAAAEFRLHLPRHAWLFSFRELVGDHEVFLDGRRQGSGQLANPRFIVNPAGVEIAGWGRNTDWRYMLALLEPDAVLRAAGEAWRPGLEIRPVVQVGDDPCWAIARAMQAECEAGNPSGPLYAEALGTALSIRLLHDHSNLRQDLSPARGALNGWRLRRVLAHLHERVAEPVTLSELAAVAGLSVSHLSHAFRAATGEAPHRYHLRLRVERAKAMLAGGTLPLAHVALACGFPNQSHFTTVFRRATGLPPGRWRDRARH